MIVIKRFKNVDAGHADQVKSGSGVACIEIKLRTPCLDSM